MTISGPLLSRKEAAAWLGVSEWQVRQLIAKGILPVVPVGARARIAADDVEKYILEHKIIQGNQGLSALSPSGISLLGECGKQENAAQARPQGH
jgi:excisionase family DNA binding protein